MQALRDKLLRLLAGSNSKQWVDRSDLLKKTGATEQMLEAELELLQFRCEINTAKVIRGVLEINAIWLTGVVSKAPFKNFTINPKKLPLSGYLTKPVPDKEAQKAHIYTTQEDVKETVFKMENKTTAPETKGTTKNLVLARIKQTPGISFKELSAFLLKEGEKSQKLSDAIWGLKRDGLIKAGLNSKRNFYLTEVQQPEMKSTLIHVPLTDEKQHIPEFLKKKPNKDQVAVMNEMVEETIHALAAKQQKEESKFRCALFTDGTVMMDIPAHGRIELTREETRDLVSYMRNIADYAENDLNL